MPKRNNAVMKLFAGLNTPVIAAFNTEKGFPKQALITSHQCPECETSLITNRMAAPSCPVCASTIKRNNPKTINFLEEDFKKLKPLGDCVNCGTGFVSNNETVASLSGVEIYCPVCAAVVLADESDENSDADSTNEDDEEVSDTDYSNDDTEEGDNESEDNSDSDSDAELTDLIKKLAPDSDNDDESKEDQTEEATETPDEEKSEDDEESTAEDDNEDANTKPEAKPQRLPINPEENADANAKPGEVKPADEKAAGPPQPDASVVNTDENKEKSADTNKPSAEKTTDANGNPEDDEEDDQSDLTASLYKAALKGVKKFDVVATSNYQNWYLMGDNSPIAVASFEKADDSVKRIFRSKNFADAFQNSLANDGGVSKELMDDYGFEPVQVSLEIDDATKQIVNDAVVDKTKDLEEKIQNVSALFEQCLGISALGNTKGLFNDANNLRTALVSKLNSMKIRNADQLVDSVLAKEMPEYLKKLMIKAKELMNDKPEALQSIAKMVAEAGYRTPVADTADNNVIPITITASQSDKDQSGNLDKGNLDKPSGRVAIDPAKLVASLDHRRH